MVDSVHTGDRVTVVTTDGRTLKLTVTIAVNLRGGTNKSGFSAEGVWRSYSREGVDWCRGWDGQAVDALCAVVALQR